MQEQKIQIGKIFIQLKNKKMKKLITILFMVFLVSALPAQTLNTFKYQIKANGGLSVGLNGEKIDSIDINTTDKDFRFYNNGDTLIPYIPVAGQTDISDIILLKHLVINPQTGSNYTLVLTDDGKLITIDHPDADTLIVPENGTVPFPIGTQITVQGIGVGLTFFKPYSGTVTLTSPDAKVTQRVRYSTVTLFKRATDTWSLIGDLK
jgi:hypothetical protein